MNKQKKQRNRELQKKYDRLSLVDRNAYEQIIQRNKSYSNWTHIPYTFIKMITLSGLFFIVTSIISGIKIETFRLSFLSIISVLSILCFYFIIFGIINDIFEYIRINKLKRKLLEN